MVAVAFALHGFEPFLCFSRQNKQRGRMVIIYVFAFVCVLLVAIGQLLFKLSAVAISESGSAFSIKAASFFIFAMVLYGATSIGWVLILKRIDLGKIYPLMAMAFIMVPIGSYMVFGEKFPSQYLFGVALIFCGVLLTLRA